MVSPPTDGQAHVTLHIRLLPAGERCLNALLCMVAKEPLHVTVVEACCFILLLLAFLNQHIRNRPNP